MPDRFPLPTGCTLRPATAADTPRIYHLLKNLEREIAPSDLRAAQWIWGVTAGASIAFVVLFGAIVPAIRLLIQLLISCVAIVALLVIALTLLMQQYEWKHYWVIEFNGYLVACAKLQRHSSHSVLFDLYVMPDWRKKGVGSTLVSFIGQQATKPLYLACMPARLPFYQRLGFAQISPKRLSPWLQYDLGLPTRPGIIPMVLS